VFKRGTAILLILALSFQCLVKLGVIVNFSINRELIAATLCINKDRPELQCNGKCHLAKELKKTDDKDQGPAPQSSHPVKVEFPVFITGTALSFSFSPAGKQSQVTPAPYPEGRPRSTIRDIFHPPGLDPFSVA
jgi:hypothetical protein